MPGYELIGEEELESIREIFTQSRGVLFAHGFDERRNGIYRVRQFEKKVAERFECAHATAVTSGTAAGFVALKALGIMPGDEVITQAFTFVATVESILACGATPIIVDCNDTLNMCPDALKNAITPRTKCIMPVHMLGAAAPMQEISTIAAANNIPIVEDACEAMGGRYFGKYLGTLGAMGFFSLDFGKMITTGEGGLILTNNSHYHDFLSAYHDHGHKNLPHLSRGNDVADVSGFNFRMTELQAAVGLVQLKRLDYILEKNRLHKSIIKQHLRERYGDHLVFRTILDELGDTADTLIFFLPTAEMAADTVKALLNKGISTKNIPSAMNWHFSGLWGHIWSHHALYKDSYQTAWKKTGNMLKCAIALNILVNTTECELDQLIDNLAQVLDKQILAKSA